MRVLVLIVAIALTGCSSDAWRVKGQSPDPDIAPMSRDAERKHVIEQGQDFCVRYPDDIACPSKGRR
jgi:hypothetical protein